MLAPARGAVCNQLLDCAILAEVVLVTVRSRLSSSLANEHHTPIPIGGSLRGGLAMGMGVGCRTLGNAP
eukprot:4900481-Pyramimonas_sp.AAC.1